MSAAIDADRDNEASYCCGFIQWFREKAKVPYVLSALSLRFHSPALETRYQLWRRMTLEERAPRMLAFLVAVLAIFYAQDVYLESLSLVMVH